MKKLLILLIIAACGVSVASAQYSAVRVNTVALATGTLNAGVDIAIADQWSIEGSAYWNPIATSSIRIDAMAFSAGMRKWRFEPHVGQFFGFQATTIFYDSGGKKNHYEGWMAGVGASFGYAWMLNTRWNITAELGVGCYYMKDTRYDYYQDPWADKIITHYNRIVIAPSRAELSFSYLF